MEMALKSLNPLNLFYNIFRYKRDSILKEPQVNSKYPLEELSKYVGELIKVYQIDGEPEISILKFPPGEEFFYLGNNDQAHVKTGEESGFHIIYWDRIYPNDGGRSAVRLIEDKYGNEIYKNDSF